MKATENFKAVILKYLEDRAMNDVLFAETFKKENKNIDDCVTYILNQVKNSGCCGFADDEVFSMAVHYYDENEIEIGSPINGKIVVNHVVELTDEEKQQAKQKAIDDLVQQERNKLLKKTTPKKEESAAIQQASLF